MDVYVLALSGGKDQDYKVIDKETWDWVTSGNMGRPEGCKDSSWIDQTIPPRVLAKIREENQDPDEEVHITLGSWENDRALFAPRLKDVPALDTLKELLDWEKGTGHNIVDTWEGCIY